MDATGDFTEQYTYAEKEYSLHHSSNVVLCKNPQPHPVSLLNTVYRSFIVLLALRAESYMERHEEHNNYCTVQIGFIIHLTDLMCCSRAG